MTRSFRAITAAGALAALVLLGGALAPAAKADDGDCDPGTIIAADNSIVYADPSCTDGEVVLIPTFPGAPLGYTRPGDTPFVNGQPVFTPYSNISTYTPTQAADARANGNLSATSNAYSQYGGFTPPGQTATREQSPSYIISGSGN